MWRASSSNAASNEALNSWLNATVFAQLAAEEAQWLSVQSKIRAPLFAACTLNATGQYRVTLSLR